MPPPKSWGWRLLVGEVPALPGGVHRAGREAPRLVRLEHQLAQHGLEASIPPRLREAAQDIDHVQEIVPDQGVLGLAEVGAHPEQVRLALALDIPQVEQRSDAPLGRLRVQQSRDAADRPQRDQGGVGAGIVVTAGSAKAAHFPRHPAAPAIVLDQPQQVIQRVPDARIVPQPEIEQRRQHGRRVAGHPARMILAVPAEALVNPQCHREWPFAAIGSPAPARGSGPGRESAAIGASAPTRSASRLSLCSRCPASLWRLSASPGQAARSARIARTPDGRACHDGPRPRRDHRPAGRPGRAASRRAPGLARFQQPVDGHGCHIGRLSDHDIP